MKVKKLYNNVINNHPLNKVSVNSKLVENNDIFVAISGSTHDGKDYLTEAIANGAKTIITENECQFPGINVIVVDDCRKELAIILKKIHHKMMKKMTFIGVTGTNGKTTTTTLVYKYLRSIHVNCSLIGSNGNYVNNQFYETINTTPDITVIYDIIEKSYKNDCEYVVIEVSSHAIKQLRVQGIDFKVVLFTNLTLDHLDFHRDFIDYQYTKGMLMRSVKENNIVILNKDSEFYGFYNYMTVANVRSYGTASSDYWIQNVNLNPTNTDFNLIFKHHKLKVKSSLIGLFNVYNMTSFIAIIDSLGLYDDRVLSFLNDEIKIPGRMEEINYQDRRIIVDYAHTPDGVYNVLSFLKTMKRRIILVVGCGGSRDKTKRTVIGEISVSNCDYVIFTSDNPRDEDEMSIIKDIIVDIEKDNYEIIVDRYMAIKKAIEISKPNDIIAILGRGNEKFQKVRGELIPLNDSDAVKEIIRGE